LVRFLLARQIRRKKKKILITLAMPMKANTLNIHHKKKVRIANQDNRFIHGGSE